MGMLCVTLHCGHIVPYTTYPGSLQKWMSLYPKCAEYSLATSPVVHTVGYLCFTWFSKVPWMKIFGRLVSVRRVSIQNHVEFRWGTIWSDVHLHPRKAYMFPWKRFHRLKKSPMWLSSNQSWTLDTHDIQTQFFRTTDERRYNAWTPLKCTDLTMRNVRWSEGLILSHVGETDDDDNEHRFLAFALLRYRILTQTLCT